ncbi:ABC-2 family transporter protein [Candidatus Daviesbacteria bacterium]|nr:ABC-2 family transporter protein [Candidatus Daviesbacteria bacterium]
MKAYLLFAKNTWNEIVTYRLNFVMWRVRNLLQLLTIYLLWATITSQSANIFGYSKSEMLTYILGVSFLTAVVMSSRTQEMGENINSGDLSIFLIRPINYFGYFLSRDLGDKAMNIVFSIAEISLVYLILKPPIFIQTNFVFLIFFIIGTTLALLLNFLIGSLLGMLGFWSPEIWAPRFLMYIVLGFLAGGSFPLDIFPKQIVNFLQLFPFTYLLYFPMKIYLGRVSSSEIFQGFLITLAWILVFYFSLLFIWNIGLKKFGAEGR